MIGGESAEKEPRPMPKDREYWRSGTIHGLCQALAPAGYGIGMLYSSRFQHRIYYYLLRTYYPNHEQSRGRPSL